ncbi:MAG: metallophosphoesterase [Pseudomonadota bacterium]
MRDFGPLDTPVVLFGGPYSNMGALEALADLIDGRPAICTGDVVAYAADPVATVNLMQALGAFCIAGNCERQVAEGGSDCGCGFAAGSTCDRLSQGWYTHLSATCDRDTIQWLADRPEFGVFTQQDRRYAVIHGGATVINRFIWPDSPTEVFLEEITAIEGIMGRVDGVIAGHSGIAFHRKIEGYQWINAGAIGLPPHDGRPETRYAVLKDGDVVIERLSYDHMQTRRRMVRSGLTQGYHEAMSSGLWPSEDVLPPSLRR